MSQEAYKICCLYRRHDSDGNIYCHTSDWNQPKLITEEDCEKCTRHNGYIKCGVDLVSFSDKLNSDATAFNLMKYERNKQKWTNLTTGV